MELLSVFAGLAERRILVALGLPFAVVVFLLLAGQLPVGPGSTPGAATGLAQARVQVDHKNAVVADTGEISDTVGAQAALLAEVASGDAPRDEIARRADIPAAELGMKRMQLSNLVALGQVAERAAQVSSGIARSYVVNIWAATPLPVLTIDVLAPDAAAAARVTRATRDTIAGLVAARAPSPERSIVIKPLGGVRAVVVPVNPPSKVLAGAAGVVAFVFWSCMIVVLTGLRRAWHDATVEAAAAGTLEEPMRTHVGRT